MSQLLDEARDHQLRRDALAARAGNRAARLFSRLDPQNLDMGWALIAPGAVAVITASQVTAARQATAYTNRVAELQDFTTDRARLIPEAFGGATREGRELAPELFAAVTTTKKLIGSGLSVPSAFRAGAGLMSLIAANAVRDMGRAADTTIATAKGFKYSVRVVNPGACSRCAILAGVKGYRTDFDRHPGCRCTSMPLADADTAPEGFYRSPDDYFESLSPAERERVFTKSGAWAIENGADPMKVVNARRGAAGIGYNNRGTGRTAPGRLQPVTIGRKAGGTPLQVYATTEGTTVRGSFGRNRNDLYRGTGDRYRRTSSVRLMPEQILKMASTPERARELLARYGYIQ